MMDNRRQCPEWIIAFLGYIDNELSRVMENRIQDVYASPFSNTGNTFSNDVFTVRAYDWGWWNDFEDWNAAGRKGEPPPEPVNFQWQDVKIWWYKYYVRDTEINYLIHPNKGIRMLEECLASIRGMDKYDV